jgi:hypothetical protein
VPEVTKLAVGVELYVVLVDDAVTVNAAAVTEKLCVALAEL